MKHAVSGSKAITDNADNVVCVWRHEDKEEKMGRAKESGDSEEIANLEKMYDALFSVQKCREDGFQGWKRLFFDYGPEGSWQYREYYSDPRGVCLLPEDVPEVIV